MVSALPAVDRLHIDIARQQLLAFAGLDADVADLPDRVPAGCRLRIE